MACYKVPVEVLCDWSPAESGLDEIAESMSVGEAILHEGRSNQPRISLEGCDSMLAEGTFERRAVIHRFGWVLRHIFNGSPSICSGTGQ